MCFAIIYAVRGKFFLGFFFCLFVCLVPFPQSIYTGAGTLCSERWGFFRVFFCLSCPIPTGAYILELVHCVVRGGFFRGRGGCLSCSTPTGANILELVHCVVRGGFFREKGGGGVVCLVPFPQERTYWSWYIV